MIGLADRALGHCFRANTAEVAASYYRKLRVPRSRPRLETLLDVVRRVHGLAALVDVLADLRQPLPNGLHEFFAAHASAGGQHVTANFDPCIEAAGSAAGQQVDVLHFHGSFAEDQSGDSLGATLARIERGFPADIGGRLSGLLTASPRQVLVFAGYSGSDFFDVDPFLQQFTGSRTLAGTVVLWVDHHDGATTTALWEGCSTGAPTARLVGPGGGAGAPDQGTNTTGSGGTGHCVAASPTGPRARNTTCLAARHHAHRIGTRAGDPGTVHAHGPAPRSHHRPTGTPRRASYPHESGR